MRLSAHRTLGSLLASCVLLTLAGCGLFGGKDDPSEPPAELIDFRASIPVRKVWSAKVGGDGEALRLGLSERKAAAP